MSKLEKSMKAQISRETEKAIEITVVKNDEIFSTWIPKSAVNMKEMDDNCLTVEGIQTFHIHQWFIDLKAKAQTIEKPSDEKTEQYETRTLSPEPAPKTETVMMPFDPTAVPITLMDVIIELKKIQGIGMETNEILRSMMK